MGFFSSLFKDGAHEDDDELFDLFMLHEVEKEDKKRRAEAEGREYDEDEDEDW